MDHYHVSSHSGTTSHALPETVVIRNGLPLTLFQFVAVARYKAKVVLHESSKQAIMECRSHVERLVSEKRVVYGVTTGFGSLNNVQIVPDQCKQLQHNLIKSHAVGMGDAAPHEVVRAMLLLRLVCISQGHSGVRYCIAEKIVEALNKGFIPFVPTQGTVGASGDLAPLSHLVLSLLGDPQSLAWHSSSSSYQSSSVVMQHLNMEPMPALAEKEGLALNNGTQFITANTALALWDAIRAFHVSNLVAALSIEALHGVSNAFDARIHHAKNHAGQISVAADIFSYLRQDGQPSEIAKNHATTKVQDAYSLRCIPQIHGVAQAAIEQAETVISAEMNSVNDNPLIFDGEVLSGGNFHGQYVGYAADILAIAMAVLCNNSERRTDRMVNKSSNGFMPSFLTKDAGVNSGLMIIQYGAAGITAENRTLATPSSVNSIPTCEGYEDIVSMAGYSARKANQSVQNALKVLAYELLTAVYALRFTEEKPNQMLHLLQSKIDPLLPSLDEGDAYLKPALDSVHSLINSEEIWQYIHHHRHPTHSRDSHNLLSHSHG